MTIPASPYLTDGAELLNAAVEILEAWHGQQDSACLGIHHLASEHGEPEKEGELAADSPEAAILYQAAVLCVCKWYGVTDTRGFLRALQTLRGGPGR